MPGESNLIIDSAMVRTVVAKSLIESLGGDQVNAIMTEAVRGLLLETKVNSYSQDTVPGSSPIGRAFQEQVNIIAREVVADYVQQEEVKTLLAEQIREALNSVVTRQGDWIYNAIGSALGDQIAVILKDNR